MTTWLPQSLFSRMSLILLLGLVLAQTLNRAIHLYQHSLKAEQLSQQQAARRAADLIRLIATLKPETRQALVEQLHDPDLRIQLVSKPLNPKRTGEGNNPQFRVFATTLNSYLGPQHVQRIIIINTAPKLLSLLVQLHDQSTLKLDIRLLPENEDGLSVLLYLAIVQFTVTGFSFVAIRWVTRPLEKLATAAEELGRDIHQPPLDESGPIEVRRAAHAFNTMQACLIRHVQDRTQLLAAISHDLKTPITRLRLRSELLDDQDLRLRFQKDLDEMEYMVRVTLDYMRGVDQQERFQPVDMMALLESLQADAQEIQAQVTIQGTMTTPYWGKPSALKRCISNLLDNAVKYGHSAIMALEENDTHCIIRVIDAGQGIPEAQLQQVLTPYYRLEASRNRGSGGTGLGLSIARDIAQAHGGGLVLGNSITGGLEAILTLAKHSAGNDLNNPKKLVRPEESRSC